LGPLPGLAFILFRFVLTVMIIVAGIARVRGDVEPLALLFAPAVVVTLFFGVLEQPMETGFMVISVAFALAALKRTRVVSPSKAALGRTPQPKRYRGTSEQVTRIHNGRSAIPGSFASIRREAK
jgi:hypothetical protein